MDLRRKKGKRQLAPLVLLLAIVAAAGGCLVFFLGNSTGEAAPAVTAVLVTNPQTLDPNGVEIQDPDSFTPNQEGEFVYTLNASPYFSSGEGAGNLLLLNHGANEYDMQVEFVLDSTGETVYQSGVIPAGCQVSAGLLNQPLGNGVYPATALLHILDPMDGEILGDLEQPVTLYVGTTK